MGAPPSGPPSSPPKVPEGAATAPLASELPGEPWFYRTPSGEVQGPFETKRMKQWHDFRYFSEDLPVKIEWYADFYPLASLFTNFEVAFAEATSHPEAELKRMQPPPPTSMSVWDDPVSQTSAAPKAPPPSQPSPKSVPSQPPPQPEARAQ